MHETELRPGAGASARVHLALALEEAGLLEEALSYARGAEQVLAQAADPDPTLQLRIDQALARTLATARAGET